MYHTTGEVIPKTLISKAEDLAEAVYNKARLHLPTLARICLLSKFLEDGFRMIAYLSFYTTWIESQWGCGVLVSHSVHLVITTCKVVASVMIGMQKKVPTACGVLFVIMIMEPLVNNTYSMFRWNDINRHLALVGNLLILLAQHQGSVHTLFAGVPTLDNNKHKNYLQFSGRCFLLFMFFTMVDYEFSFFQILKFVVGTVLFILVLIGYKTKLSAFILIVFLLIFNFYKNTWWNDTGFKRGHHKHKFFHAFSVIGGLLLVVLHGPGGISLDEAKKRL